jgi:hypothetical protein
MVLERWTNPKLSRRACTCEYGLRYSTRKSAGVAKWPRERSPTPNPYRYDSQLVCIAVRSGSNGGGEGVEGGVSVTLARTPLTGGRAGHGGDGGSAGDGAGRGHGCAHGPGERGGPAPAAGDTPTLPLSSLTPQTLSHTLRTLTTPPNNQHQHHTHLLISDTTNCWFAVHVSYPTAPGHSPRVTMDTQPRSHHCYSPLTRRCVVSFDPGGAAGVRPGLRGQRADHLAGGADRHAGGAAADGGGGRHRVARRRRFQGGGGGTAAASGGARCDELRMVEWARPEDEAAVEGWPGGRRGDGEQARQDVEYGAGCQRGTPKTHTRHLPSGGARP